MKSTTLSVIIIARNEEDMIEDCLESVSFASEIIVVDNNSTDDTLQIAKKHKAKVITTNGSSFALLREIGLSKATGKYVLYVDADERVTSELQKEIENHIAGDDFDSAIIPRQNYYLGNHMWPKIEHFPRLFKKSSLKGWRGELHETPVSSGKSITLDSAFKHYTHRDFTSMVSKTNEWSEVEAMLRFKSNHPKIVWWRFVRVMLTAFYDSYIKQGGYKAGKVGYMESMYQAFSMFITYAKLWELQSKKNER